MEIETLIKERKSLSEASMIFIDNEVNVLEELRIDFQYNKVDLSNIVFTTRYEELLEIISKCKIDIIVSDFRMPEKNGIELLENVRKHYPSMILVIRTGYTISFDSQEREKCDASNIKILFKHDGFEHMCANLGNFINETGRCSEKNINFKQKDEVFSEMYSYFPKFIPMISNYIKTIVMYDEKNKKINTLNVNEDWIKVTEVPGKILKILHDKVQCECMINTSLKRTQIRDFSLLLFTNINDLKEGMFIQVRIKIKPGISCTEILDGSTLNYEKYFEIEDWDELNDFELVKLH